MPFSLAVSGKVSPHMSSIFCSIFTPLFFQAFSYVSFFFVSQRRSFLVCPVAILNVKDGNSFIALHLENY